MAGVAVAYNLTNWKYLISLAVGIPTACSMVGFFWLKETPLFLLSKRKFKRFRKVLLHVAKLNKKKLSKSFVNYQKRMVS